MDTPPSLPDDRPEQLARPERALVHGSSSPTSRSGLAHGLDRSLPWAAMISALAGILITALSVVPPHLPGIALDSTPLFLVERGGLVVAALILVVGLVGRTLKRELPTGFFPATGALTYTEKTQAAADSSEASAAELVVRLDEQDAYRLHQEAYARELAKTLEGVIADVKRLKEP